MPGKITTCMAERGTAVKNLVIDRSAVKSNLQAAKNRAKGAEIIADLTGDAYGLGLLETAKLLRDGGVHTFAVSDPKDADTLRKAGFIEERLMMLRSTADSDELAELIDLGVICTVGSYEAAVAINGIAESRKTVCEVQIKIDTGMGRYGFISTETDKIASIFKYMPNLAIVGIFSTYSRPWKSKKATLAQLDVFHEVMDKLTEMGFELGSAHICDSAALFKYDSDKLDAVRIGEALSGRMPGGSIPGLTKVGYVEASVEEVGWFPKGHRVGSTVLRKPALLAVLSVGYYNGIGIRAYGESAGLLKRILGRGRNRPSVKIRGQRVKAVGGVGMTHTVVDVTKVKCAVGDRAVVDVNPMYVRGIPRIYK